MYKPSLSKLSSDCNEFSIKFPDYLDMQVYMEYLMSWIKNYIFVGAVKEDQNVCPKCMQNKAWQILIH